MAQFQTGPGSGTGLVRDSLLALGVAPAALPPPSPARGALRSIVHVHVHVLCPRETLCRLLVAKRKRSSTCVREMERRQPMSPIKKSPVEAFETGLATHHPLR